jgi:hypothetical protein
VCFICYDEEYCNLQEEIERGLETYFDVIKQRPEIIKGFFEKEIEVYNVI